MDSHPRPEHIETDTTRLRRSHEAARILRRRSTDGERILWDALRNRKLGGRKFRHQQPIAGFVVDFYCAEERLAIEVDGPIHTDQFSADEERQAIIESPGIRFLRFDDAVVRSDLPAVLRKIADCFERSSLSSSPSPLDGEGVGG